MRTSYSIIFGFVQAALTQILLFSWRALTIENLQDLFTLAGSFSILLLLVSIYGLLASLLFRHQQDLLKFFLIPLTSSLLTTLSLLVYPQLGFNDVPWPVLFLLLLFAGIIAHLFLFRAGARMGGADP